MDIVKDRHRFVGSRTEVLAEVQGSRKGVTGYEMLLACRTPSRRAFLLSVSTTAQLVTEWDAFPMDFDEMMEVLAAAGHDVTAYEDLANRPTSDATAAALGLPAALPKSTQTIEG